VGDSVENLTKVKLNDIHCYSSVLKSSQFINEASQAAQEWFTLGKFMVTASNHLFLHMLVT